MRVGDFWEEKHNNLFGALSVGMTTFGGGLWLLPHSGIREAFAGDERRAAAALLAFFATQFLAGFPAGWLAGSQFRETPLPVWASMTGAYLVPALGWFAGLEPGWPACWAWAWGLALAGSWVGLGLGLVAAKRKGRKS